MDFLKKDFGEKLKKAIKNAGKSQTALAKFLEVKDATVSRWVNGIDSPEDDRLSKIFDFLDITEDYFLNKEPAKPKIRSVADMTPEELAESVAKIMAANKALNVDNQVTEHFKKHNNNFKVQSEKDELISRIASLLPRLEVNHLRGVVKLIQNKIPVEPTKKPKNTRS